jgi:hypothetical protein
MKNLVARSFFFATAVIFSQIEAFSFPPPDTTCYRYGTLSDCEDLGNSFDPEFDWASNDRLCSGVSCTPHLQGIEFVWTCDENTEDEDYPGDYYHREHTAANSTEWYRDRYDIDHSFTTGPGMKRVAPATNPPEYPCFVFGPCKPGENCTTEDMEEYYCQLDTARDHPYNTPDYVLNNVSGCDLPDALWRGRFSGFLVA